MDFKKFNEDGFMHLKNHYTNNNLEKIENIIIKLLAMQAAKISDYKLDVAKILSTEDENKEKIRRIWSLMEDKDKEALNQVQRFLYQSVEINKIFNESLLNLCSEILGVNTDLLLVNGPALFVNPPNNNRLLYKWHSESHYYPKRRRLLNIWIPLFTNKNKNNGTMSFKLGSHKFDFPYSDYRGYDSDSLNKSNHYIQYEIPENFLENHMEFFCEVDRGDIIIFDKSLVHKSNANKTDEWSYAAVARVWSPIDDLTLSGNIEATPYGGNIGRPGLIVNP
jgi:hypothetical protein